MKIKVGLCIVGLLIVALPFNAFGQPITGACCLPQGTCQVLNFDDCFESSGSYLGDFTTCGPDTCQLTPATAIPTMNEWGMIIFMVLAGLGSIYYLRRQRRA